VIVGAEAFSSAEIAQLSSCGHVVGRLLVDADVDTPVDHDAVPVEAMSQFDPKPTLVNVRFAAPKPCVAGRFVVRRVASVLRTDFRFG
jgi:hypothetical protein